MRRIFKEMRRMFKEKKNDPTFNLDSWYRKVNFKSDQHQQVSICGDMSDDALYPKYTTLCEVRDVILCQLAAFSALMLTLLRSYQHVLLGGYVNKINLGWEIHLYRKRISVHTGQSTRVLNRKFADLLVYFKGLKLAKPLPSNKCTEFSL